MELVCAVQQYAWGVPGKASSVAQLAQAMQPSLIIDDDKPYAELWMGTHPNGPSVLKGDGKALASYISEEPSCLGSQVTGKFGKQLPFLFKVLSVNKALSIQAHPNKTHAEQLHSARPDVYKDPNHKPEMTIALTPFLALCGFRPHSQIIAFFKALPELCTVIGSEAVVAFMATPDSGTLRTCFTGLMTADKGLVAQSLTTVQKRLEAGDSSTRSHLHADVFLTALSQYPGDAGCFSLYLLNIVSLQPGQAMFLGPNVIHAYLKGDCVECMACSDNVVRAGLTPKYQDVDTLLAMLDYTMSDADSRIFQASALDDCCQLFNPPVPDFAVEAIKISKGKQYTLRSIDSCSIVLVVGGAGAITTPPSAASLPTPPASTIARGSVLFLPANYTFAVTASEEVTAFRALCE